jgi:hypothetical protein
MRNHLGKSECRAELERRARLMGSLRFPGWCVPSPHRPQIQGPKVGVHRRPSAPPMAPRKLTPSPSSRRAGPTKLGCWPGLTPSGWFWDIQWPDLNRQMSRMLGRWLQSLPDKL